MSTGPDAKLIDVPAPTLRALSGKPRSTTLLPGEARFLYEYTCRGNMRAALEAAGYHPATDALARDMANEILRKVNEAMDCRDALTAAGMGTAEWVRCLYGLAHEENPKWRIAALKLWGLALGVFSERPQGMGATILLGGKTDPQGQQAAVGMRIQWPSRRRDALGPVPAGDDPQLTPSAEG